MQKLSFVKWKIKSSQNHKHDQTSRRGLINIVGKRAKLLKYLRSNDNEKYLELTKALNIRK